LRISSDRYSQRCYFIGNLSKNTQTDKWILDIGEVKCRFHDDFSFDDESDWYNPFTWGSQILGFWKNDTDNPVMPSRAYFIGSLLLENSDFRELRKSLEQVVKNSCNDFFIYSNTRTIDDEFIEKSIAIL